MHAAELVQQRIESSTHQVQQAELQVRHCPFFVGDYFMMPDHVGTRSSDWRRISTRLGTC